MELTPFVTPATPVEVPPDDLEPARKLVQAELRALMVSKDTAARVAASLALLMAAQVRGE